MEIKSGNIGVSTTHLRVPPAMEALQAEILRHPNLMQELRLEQANGRFNTFEDGLAMIAAYVEVTLHGVYGADEVAGICDTLVRKLQEKRSSLT